MQAIYITVNSDKWALNSKFELDWIRGPMKEVALIYLRDESTY